MAIRLRYRAMTALYNLDSKRSVPQIEKMLADSDALVREGAIHLLTYAEARGSLEAISRLQNDPAEIVRRVAKAAVGELSVPVRR